MNVCLCVQLKPEQSTAQGLYTSAQGAVGVQHFLYTAEAYLRIGELGDIIHAAAILLPLGGEVQHLLAFHAGPFALQPDVAQVVGELEGVGRCVHDISFLSVCRRCTLWRTAV